MYLCKSNALSSLSTAQCHLMNGNTYLILTIVYTIEEFAHYVIQCMHCSTSCTVHVLQHINNNVAVMSTLLSHTSLVLRVSTK